MFQVFHCVNLAVHKESGRIRSYGHHTYLPLKFFFALPEANTKPSRNGPDRISCILTSYNADVVMKGLVDFEGLNPLSGRIAMVTLSYRVTRWYLPLLPCGISRRKMLRQQMRMDAEVIFASC